MMQCVSWQVKVMGRIQPDPLLLAERAVFRSYLAQHPR